MGYELSGDWAGTLYYGIPLDYHYEEGYVEIAMPRYIERVLFWFKHEMPKQPQDCPYKPPTRTFSTTSQKPVPEDTSEHVDATRIQKVQQVVGCVLYYSRAVDCTVLVTLSSIASK